MTWHEFQRTLLLNVVSRSCWMRERPRGKMKTKVQPWIIAEIRFPSAVFPSWMRNVILPSSTVKCYCWLITFRIFEVSSRAILCDFASCNHLTADFTKSVLISLLLTFKNISIVVNFTRVTWNYCKIYQVSSIGTTWWVIKKLYAKRNCLFSKVISRFRLHELKDSPSPPPHRKPYA